MEDFSQSRGDDDLFDDEIIPIERSPSPEKAQVPPPQAPVYSQPPTVPSDVVSPSPNTTVTQQRGRGRGRGGPTRGGGGGVPPKQNDLMASKFAPKPSPPVTPSSLTAVKPQNAPKEATDRSTPDAPLPSPVTADLLGQPAELLPPTQPNPPPPTPAGPSSAGTPTQARTPAVRGSRLATGGIQKPKLSEAELTAKLAAAKERSQNVAAAHARAQADAASFEERERVARKKRDVETKNRRAMEGEREKNRERKLKGLGGREWDMGKEEDAITGRGDPPRPNRENAEEEDLSMYEWHEGRGRGGRGGRGRGRGGRGAGGRGGAANGHNNNSRRQPNVSAETDFPALPVSTKRQDPPQQQSKPTPKRLDSDLLPSAGGGGSWADQVESSEAAKA